MVSPCRTEEDARQTCSGRQRPQRAGRHGRLHELSVEVVEQRAVDHRMKDTIAHAFDDLIEEDRWHDLDIQPS